MKLQFQLDLFNFIFRAIIFRFLFRRSCWNVSTYTAMCSRTSRNQTFKAHKNGVRLQFSFAHLLIHSCLFFFFSFLCWSDRGKINILTCHVLASFTLLHVIHKHIKWCGTCKMHMDIFNHFPHEWMENIHTFSLKWIWKSKAIWKCAITLFAIANNDFLYQYIFLLFSQAIFFCSLTKSHLAKKKKTWSEIECEISKEKLQRINASLSTDFIQLEAFNLRLLDKLIRREKKNRSEKNASSLRQFTMKSVEIMTFAFYK